MILGRLFSWKALAPKDRLGRAGEEAAASALARSGYRILGRRLRTPFGEIDLLAEREELVVFVEVKTRGGDGFARPGEAVDAVRRERLRKAALHLHRRRRDLRGRPLRIDVVEILWLAGQPARVQHLEDAVDRGQF